ncbi:hypothetical protein LOTGIDRAFT_208084 [Lottia gigantea]|uniref:PGAP2-interacting protein n=1 Tax=Lottia gigantea TaxID=225164 RepID=V4CRK8_LOTGI|nr:hypothetical protein LOTGIDRAFT_208084 [Lottia gigantea]ESP05150.1 hypothetical protein LOTGIDRAFT_208084 [Lottia gigantea]
MRSFIQETIDGFIFWSVFQALSPLIWFFPLNELEISGYEAFAGFWFMPIICGIPKVLRLFQTRWMIMILKLVVVGCLSSFQAATTLRRLIILATGAGVSMVIFAICLCHPNLFIRQSYFRSLIFGYFALLSGRIWFTTFIPTWWSDMTNSVVIALGVAATLDYLFNSDVQQEKKMAITSTVRPNWFCIGLGTGSLLFATHWCFGEVSVITRWVVKGYPDSGPNPLPWGAAILLAIFTGVLISLIPRITNSYYWFLFGAASLSGLYYFPTFKGLGSGLLFAVFLSSLWPKFINYYSRCPPARTTVVTMATYIAEILFSVWTVAFNFVPGGTYTRERSDILICIVLITIFLVYVADNRSYNPSDLIGSNYNFYTAWLFIIVVIGAAGIGYRQAQFSKKMSNVKPTSTFSSAIWTYHFGYDNEGWPSLERASKLLNETGADVVTLLESDASKPFLGNNDIASWIGEHLGMYSDFGPSTRDHTWGNLILSKYPIVKSHHHLLPSPHGELAPAITATINITGFEVDFIVSHMGNDRDKLDRNLQSDYLAKECKAAENPVVFMAYVTSTPNSQSYKRFINFGEMKDIDKTDEKRFCEYIFYRNLIRLGYARITHGGLSDTELQMAKFKIPRDVNNFKDHDIVTSNPDIPPKSNLFNPYFGKHYPTHISKKVHRFHMNTPKYFLLAQ